MYKIGRVKKMNREYKIGEVVLVKFYGDGHIQNGIRPAIIIQNNIGNRHSPTLQVIPLTSQVSKKPLPTHVFISAGIGGLQKNSIALCEGQRIINKNNILKQIGILPDEYMQAICMGCLINTPLLIYLSQQQIIQLHGRLVR